MQTLIDERKYPSTRRGSTATYLCKKWGDGSYSCDCPGWRFKQPDKPRGCSHCEWFKQDYYLLNIADASRVALTGVKYDVITTYGRFLYLVKFLSGETYRPKGTGTISGGTGEEKFLPVPDSVPGGRLPRLGVLPKKAVILTPKPGRARNAFDEEV